MKIREPYLLKVFIVVVFPGVNNKKWRFLDSVDCRADKILYIYNLYNTFLLKTFRVMSIEPETEFNLKCCHYQA